jgi:capsular polysaccharide transport system permease protein
MFKPIPIPEHSPWARQLLVIGALLNRELATRFGEYRLGFFWMLFEPLLSVVMIGVIIGSIAGRTVPEIPYAFFLLNGKLLLNLFKGSMNTGLNAIASNQGLLVYPTVRPLDLFIARFVYEIMTILFSFTLFCLIGMFIGIELSLGSLDLLFACYLMTWLMGCGLGLIFSVAAAHFNEVEKFVKVLQSPLVFVSAVLFPISSMPVAVQNLLLYNPLVHPIELSRKALFPFYHAEGAVLTYPFEVTIVVLAIGLTLFHGNRNFLTQR